MDDPTGKRTEIRIAGFGGQGIVLAGEILGQSAILEGSYAVQTQSYGPESRGGAARTEVIISNGIIDYPRVIEADILIALSQMAFDKYCGSVKENGVTLVDAGLVKTDKSDVSSIPFTQIANDLGNKVVANSVMLGYLIASTNVISNESLKTIIRDKVPERTIELNMKAFQAGFERYKN